MAKVKLSDLETALGVQNGGETVEQRLATVQNVLARVYDPTDFRAKLNEPTGRIITTGRGDTPVSASRAEMPKVNSDGTLMLDRRAQAKLRNTQFSPEQRSKMVASLMSYQDRTNAAKEAEETSLLDIAKEVKKSKKTQFGPDSILSLLNPLDKQGSIGRAAGLTFLDVLFKGAEVDTTVNPELQDLQRKLSAVNQYATSDPDLVREYRQQTLESEARRLLSIEAGKDDPTDEEVQSAIADLETKLQGIG